MGSGLVSMLLLNRLADEADALADDCADKPLLLAGIADIRRTALIRLAIVDSETIRPPQTEASRSSLLTTRSWFLTRKTKRSKTCGSIDSSEDPRRSSRRFVSRTQSSNKNRTLHLERHVSTKARW